MNNIEEINRFCYESECQPRHSLEDIYQKVSERGEGDFNDAIHGFLEAVLQELDIPWIHFVDTDNDDLNANEFPIPLSLKSGGLEDGATFTFLGLEFIVVYNFGDAYLTCAPKIAVATNLKGGQEE